MRLKLNQYFCRHNLRYIARHGFTQQNLFKCNKCGVFYIQHYGIGIGYFSKTPHLEHWEYESESAIKVRRNYNYEQNIKHLIERYENKIKWLEEKIDADDEERYENGMIHGLDIAIYDLKDILDNLNM